MPLQLSPDYIPLSKRIAKKEKAKRRVFKRKSERVILLLGRGNIKEGSCRYEEIKHKLIIQFLQIEEEIKEGEGKRIAFETFAGYSKKYTYSIYYRTTKMGQKLTYKNMKIMHQIIKDFKRYKEEDK